LIKHELAQAVQLASWQRKIDEERAQQIKMQLLADLMQSKEDIQLLNEADVFDYSNLQARTMTTDAGDHGVSRIVFNEIPVQARH
jgi:hypothetical protein